MSGSSPCISADREPTDGVRTSVVSDRPLKPPRQLFHALITLRLGILLGPCPTFLRGRHDELVSA